MDTQSRESRSIIYAKWPCWNIFQRYLKKITDDLIFFFLSLYQEAVILKATNYLWSNFKELSHPYSVAITAYSLSVRRAEDITRALHWSKFEAKGNMNHFNSSILQWSV